MNITSNTLLHRERRNPQLDRDQALWQEQAKAGSDVINRLICAALVSEEFQKKLLLKPSDALKDGYGKENFSLTPKERLAVLSVDAATLDEFVVTLMDQLAEPSSSPVKENKRQVNLPYPLAHSSVGHGAD